MTKATITASVVMFSVPFFLLAACYSALPAELTVLRNPIAGVVRLAQSQSSPCSVFPS